MATKKLTKKPTKDQLLQQLPKSVRDAVADFDDCAKDWGWMSDSGVGTPVIRSEKNYHKSYYNLLEMLAKMRQRDQRKTKPCTS